MEFKRQNLATLFTKIRCLEVPFFQRAYVWEKGHLERLLEDVEGACSTKRPYFMGVLILKQKRTQSGEGDVRIVIDGQQRLTALSILCKVLCLKNGEMKKFDRRFRLRDGSIALRHNDYDFKVYEQIMALKQIENIESNSKVAETYKYFCKNLKPEKLDLNRICDSISFANIDLSENENEQEIFDTINTLGARLTPVELLKNYLFFQGKGAREKYKKYWEDVFEKDEETRSYWNRQLSRYEDYLNIDIFFFSYLQIKIRGKETSTKDPSAPKEEVLFFDSYKDFTRKCKNEKKSTILDEILEYSNLFKATIDEQNLERPLPVRGVERINAIIFSFPHMAMVVPYILFVEKNVKDEGEKNKLYDCLEAYIVRQILVLGICDVSLLSRKLISEHILSANDLRNYLKSQREKERIYMPTDEYIRHCFHRNSSISNRNAKIILYLMESKIQEKKYQSYQLLKLSEYTIEHIMPRDWREKWPESKNPKERDKKLKTLGNLTIVTQALNSRVDNRTWKEKRVELENHSGGIKTLCGALKKRQWNEKAIDERAERLADIAIRIWPGI